MYTKEETNEFKRLLELKANNGDADSAYTLGKISVVNKDYKSAFSWFYIAYQNNSAEAKSEIEKFLNVTKDPMRLYNDIAVSCRQDIHAGENGAKEKFKFLNECFNQKNNIESDQMLNSVVSYHTLMNAVVLEKKDKGKKIAALFLSSDRLLFDNLHQDLMNYGLTKYISKAAEQIFLKFKNNEVVKRDMYMISLRMYALNFVNINKSLGQFHINELDNTIYIKFDKILHEKSTISVQELEDFLVECKLINTSESRDIHSFFAKPNPKHEISTLPVKNHSLDSNY